MDAMITALADQVDFTERDTTYNGWSNYATWRVNLELIGDEDWSCCEERFSDENALVQYLDEMVDNIVTKYGELQDGFALDYARAFVSNVNFHEIAESIISDNPEVLVSDEDDEDDDEEDAS